MKTIGDLSLVFQYEKFFQYMYVHTVQTYFSFWLVIGQISAYVWSISSLEIEKDRDSFQRNQIEFLHHFFRSFENGYQKNNC